MSSDSKNETIETRNNNFDLHLLVTAPTYFIESVRAQIEKSYKVTYAYEASYEELLDLVETIDAWIVDPGANYKIDVKILTRAKNLKIIVSPSTGSDHVDLNYLNLHSIKFDCLKGKEDIIENIHASAEFSFALLMSMIRNLVPAANYATSGFWREKEDELRGIELSGKKVGIIGFGRIGKKMTNFCLAFGAKMIIYDPFVSIEKEGLNQVDTLDELLKASDIVSVHVHLDSTTKNLIGEKEFEMMRDQAYFLNTSRGGTVAEDALIKALRDRKLAAAAVDVISGEQEENISEHKLINFSKDNKNFLITPHIAGATIDSQRKAFEFALDEVDKFFN